MGTDSEMTYSVLMAVYGKESPEFFRQSIESMLRLYRFRILFLSAMDHCPGG